MNAILLIIFIVLISLGIYKIGSKSADDAKAIGKYDIEDLQRQERYNYTDSDEDEEERKKKQDKYEELWESSDTTGDPSFHMCSNNIAYTGD